LEATMAPILKQQNSAHWVEVLDEAGVPCGPVNNYEQLFNDPQTQHRGMVVYADDPELGNVPHVRTPIRIGDGIAVRTVAPKLGQHNEEVFGGAGVDQAALAKLKASGVV
ncbi:MAG TPA: CoA transferase, partial [Hyphomicrobiaceae bacterium]|nr:CoA transferase [Hyphomicrobiaceae bacterium]